MTDGSIEATDIRLTAFTLAGPLNWPARWHRAEAGGMSADAVASQMVDILTNGLAPR